MQAATAAEVLAGCGAALHRDGGGCGDVRAGAVAERLADRGAFAQPTRWAVRSRAARARLAVGRRCC